MDVEKIREGGIALCLAAMFGIAWLALRGGTDLAGIAALGALLAALIGLWRIAAGLAGGRD